MREEDEKQDYVLVGDVDEEEMAAFSDVLKGRYSIRPLLIAIAVGIALICLVTIWYDSTRGDFHVTVPMILFLSLAWTIWIAILYDAVVIGKRNWKRHPGAVICAICLFLYMTAGSFLEDLYALFAYDASAPFASFGLSLLGAPMRTQIFLRLFLLIADGKDAAKQKIQQGKDAKPAQPK